MSEDKKIIIDEDWKSQVQAEKEQAKQGQKPSSSHVAASDSSSIGDMPMPPASFEMLVTTLATEALVSLGQIQHPVTNEFHVHRNQAKYLIDTIDVLKQKTAGNLTSDEQQMLEEVLYQLKMVFVETAGEGSGDHGTPPVDHLA